jgi:hypothetical protein
MMNFPESLRFLWTAWKGFPHFLARAEETPQLVWADD